jgi:RimJ/RimL family protein N-acetyltransferase
MKSFEQPPKQESAERIIEIGSLDDFDSDYFKKLEGENGWIAIGQENCDNQRYFTVRSTDDEKLGIVGVYDTAEDKNITHTVVDPRFRGRGLTGEFKDRLMDELGLASIILTIDVGNEASIRAAEKLSGVQRMSDARYEQEFNKVKFVYSREGEGAKKSTSS